MIFCDKPEESKEGAWLGVISQTDKNHYRFGVLGHDGFVCGVFGRL